MTLEALQPCNAASGMVLAASGLLRDARGNIAMVENSYNTGWTLPGGTVEADESPSEACLRELQEEIGYQVGTIGPLLSVHWSLGTPARPVRSVNLTFDVGVCANPARLRPQPEEISRIAFFPAEDLPDSTRPGVALRIAMILRLAGSGIAYVEENRSPTTLSKPS